MDSSSELLKRKVAAGGEVAVLFAHSHHASNHALLSLEHLLSVAKGGSRHVTPFISCIIVIKRAQNGHRFSATWIPKEDV